MANFERLYGDESALDLEKSSDPPSSCAENQFSSEAQDRSLVLQYAREKEEAGSIEHAMPPAAEIQHKLTRRPSELLKLATSITQGGIRHSMLTLTSTAIGGGVLAVSYVFRLCGVGLGLVMLAVGGMLAYLSIIELMHMSSVSRHGTYAGLFAHCAGRRAGPLLDLMLFLYGNGSCVGYFVFLGDFIPDIGSLLAAGSPAVKWVTGRTMAIFVCSAILAPLACLPDVSTIGRVSPVCLFALVYMAVVIAIRTPTEYTYHLQDPSYGDVVPAKLSLNIIEAFPICLFAFNCHMNVVPVAGTFVRPTRHRIKRVSWMVNATQLSFYALIGVTGYLSFLGRTPQDILNGYDVSDPFVAIGRMLLSMSMLVAIAMNIVPTVKSGLQFVGYFMDSQMELVPPTPVASPLPTEDLSVCSTRSGTPTPTSRSTNSAQVPLIEKSSSSISGNKVSPWPRIVIALFCVFGEAFVAINVPGIADVIGLLGATVATAMVLLIPAYCSSVVLPSTRNLRIIQVLFYTFGAISIASVPLKILIGANVIPQPAQ